MAGKPHHRAKDITGLTSDSLTALRFSHSDGKKSWWEVQCKCGKVITMPASELQKGKQKSCGCEWYFRIGLKNSTHGMSDTPMYAVYRSMIDRCRLPTHQAWRNYGARGIRVCER